MMTGADLKAARETRGWSQLQVSSAVGYSVAAIRLWEGRENRALPRAVSQWVASLRPLPSAEPRYPGTVDGLAKLIRDRHYSQEGLARLMGVRRFTLYRWRKRQVGLPPWMVAWLEHGAPRGWPWVGPPAR